MLPGPGIHQRLPNYAPFMKPKLYVFNWPDAVGGAGTKVWHLLRLLRGEFAITVVPNEGEKCGDGVWGPALAELGVEVRPWGRLPRRLSGWGVSLCNGFFLRSGRAGKAKKRGLKIAWGSEMMWHHSGEQASVYGGLVDMVLYTSEVQRAVLLPGYTCHGLLPEPRGVVVGNYIDPECYASRWDGMWRRPLDGTMPPGRRHHVLTAGRVSRADAAKFPDDFPLTMHFPGVERLHVRVLGWSAALTERFSWYDFEKGRVRGECRGAVMPQAGRAAMRKKSTGRLRHARATEQGQTASPVGTPSAGKVTWELLPAGAEDVCAFLHSLDVYVYDVGPGLRESWGRSVVEAMLSGLPVLIPADRRHHLHELVPHGVAGFHCETRGDWERGMCCLTDPAMRERMGRAAAANARRVLCNAEEHRAVWREALG